MKIEILSPLPGVNGQNQGFIVLFEDFSKKEVGRIKGLLEAMIKDDYVLEFSGIKGSEEGNVLFFEIVSTGKPLTTKSLFDFVNHASAATNCFEKKER